MKRKRRRVFVVMFIVFLLLGVVVNKCTRPDQSQTNEELEDPISTVDPYTIRIDAAVTPTPEVSPVAPETFPSPSDVPGVQEYASGPNTEESREEGLEEGGVVFYEEIPLSEELQGVLFEVCGEYRIDPAIVLGLIYTESRFKDDVVSSCGCYGLMQLNPMYFPSDLTPEDNIRYGVEYLWQNVQKYGDMRAALTAYAMGHDNGTRYYANLVLENAADWVVVLNKEVA